MHMNTSTRIIQLIGHVDGAVGYLFLRGLCTIVYVFFTARQNET